MQKKKNSNKSKGNKTSQKPGLNKTLYIAIASIIVLILVGFFLAENKLLPGQKNGSTQDSETIEYEKTADKYLVAVKVEMAKPVSPYKFIIDAIDDVEKYSWMALDIDSTLSTSWERLGYVYAQVHGQQAMLRYESYKTQDQPEKIIEEEKNVILYFAKANLYYDKALEYGSKDSAYIYYLKSEAAVIQRLYDQAALSLVSATYLDPKYRKYKAKLIEAYLNGGRFDRALIQINQYKTMFTDSDVPYIHLAGYYYNIGDTIASIENYELAIEKGTKPDVGKFLHNYYTQHNNPEKAEYYLQKAYEAKAVYDPERY